MNKYKAIYFKSFTSSEKSWEKLVVDGNMEVIVNADSFELNGETGRAYFYKNNKVKKTLYTFWTNRPYIVEEIRKELIASLAPIAQVYIIQ